MIYRKIIYYIHI